MTGRVEYREPTTADIADANLRPAFVDRVLEL
jgi:hypothetical protein